MCSRKRNVNLVKITCLSALLLNTIIVTSAQISEGNPCTMDDGTAGICAMHSNCEFWMNKMRRREFPKGSDVCGYQANDPIVCCPGEKPTEKPTENPTEKPTEKPTEEHFFWPDEDENLSEGSKCTMETDGAPGTCVPIRNCMPRIKEVMQGKRFNASNGRCSYDGATEIVCCPDVIPSPSPSPSTDPTPTNTTPSNLRPAARACKEYNDLATDNRGLDVDNHIIGGEVALPGQLPFMAALGYRNNPDDPSNISYICGGSLLTERHVLTAAHCASNINNYVPIEVRLGSTDLRVEDEDTQRIPISDIVIHPNHRPSMNYFDIAIIVMERPAILKSNKTVPICLLTFQNNNLDFALDRGLLVAGWGVTDYNSIATSPQLRYTRNLTLIDKETCAADYQSSNRVPQGVDDSLICILDKNPIDRSDACQGDSGGPLYLRTNDAHILYGIVSFGQSCASSVPGIYTSVLYHLDWIESHVWPSETSNVPEEILQI